MNNISVITPVCMMCFRTSTMSVNKEHFDAWKAGAMIQDAFPELNADERELLLTGTHPECWNEMMDDFE